MATRKTRSTALTPRQQRTAWWLFAVREVVGMTQKEVYPKLKFKAASSLSDLERGRTAASLEQLEVAADLYGVPLSLFTSPPATDEERINQLRAGAPLDPDDVLIPLSVLRRLGQEALERVAAGDTAALREATLATPGRRPPGSAGAAA